MSRPSLHNDVHPERMAAEEDEVAAARRNPQAFGALYDRYVQPVYRYLLSRTASVEEAQDLTSQVFLTAFESFSRYRHDGYFAAWLFAIARTKFIDHLRRRKRRPETPLEEVPGPDNDLLQQVGEAERIRYLKRHIQDLDEGEKELLRLRYVAGLSFAEMARLLGRSQGAVKKSLYRLLARLQSQVEDNRG
jgi:RNA polymerase sigma-70 factor (ECF subfamily)